LTCQIGGKNRSKDALFKVSQPFSPGTAFVSQRPRLEA
jgi:hypothetical protein